ncbi:hypothetical protein SCA6_019057 [Theobroma cacao]
MDFDLQEIMRKQSWHSRKLHKDERCGVSYPNSKRGVNSLSKLVSNPLDFYISSQLTSAMLETVNARVNLEGCLGPSDPFLEPPHHLVHRSHPLNKRANLTSVR